MLLKNTSAALEHRGGVMKNSKKSPKIPAQEEVSRVMHTKSWHPIGKVGESLPITENPRLDLSLFY